MPTFQALLAQNAIHLYGTRNQEIKASQAERKIRDLKRRIYRMQQASNSKRYIDSLQDIEHALNHAHNRVVDMSAADASKKENEAIVFFRRYEKNARLTKKEASFRPNDLVRIAVAVNVFTRGYKRTFSTETYRVVEQRETRPRVYRVVAEGGGLPLDKAFYSPQLQRVEQPFQWT